MSCPRATLPRRGPKSAGHHARLPAINSQNQIQTIQLHIITAKPWRISELKLPKRQKAPIDIASISEEEQHPLLSSLVMLDDSAARRGVWVVWTGPWQSTSTSVLIASSRQPPYISSTRHGDSLEVSHTSSLIGWGTWGLPTGFMLETWHLQPLTPTLRCLLRQRRWVSRVLGRLTLVLK